MQNCLDSMNVKFNFKPYNPNLGLIMLHIPKCAGQSLQISLEMACNNSYCLSYFYPDIGVNLAKNWNSRRSIVLGHFIRWKGQSIETTCPLASQFITILRDPFDVCVSAYFYGLKEGFTWATSMSIEDFLNWWLLQDFGPLTGALPEFKFDESVIDYCKRFVYIGTVSKIDRFYSEVGRILGVKFEWNGIANTSEYTKSVPDLRSAFRRKFSRDYLLYDFVDCIAA